MIFSSSLFAEEQYWDRCTWKGEIRFVYTKMGNYSGENTDNPLVTAHSEYNEQLDATLIIQVCVNGGRYATVIAQDVHYERDDNAFWQRDHKMCLREDGKTSYRAEPGDTWSASQTMSGTLADETKPQMIINLIVGADGSYTLMAGGSVYYSMTQKEVITDKDGCDKEEKSTTTHIFPDSDSSSSSIDNEGPHRSLSGSLPPMPLPMMVIAHGKVTDGVISGDTMLIDDQKDGRHGSKYGKDINQGEGDWSERMTASWNLKAMDSCEQVKEQLRESMSFLIAYNDATILNQGLDSKAYDDAIGSRAAKMYAASWGAGSSGSQSHYEVETDLGVNSNCEIVGEDAFRESQKQACIPDAITDVIIGHEKTHVAQCQDDRDKFIRGLKHDPHIRSKFEIEAYCLEIDILLRWLSENCPYDISEYEDMIKYICQ
jgi:hypothetical protein